jgi:hypothetical protein
MSTLGGASHVNPSLVPDAQLHSHRPPRAGLAAALLIWGVAGLCSCSDPPTPTAPPATLRDVPPGWWDDSSGGFPATGVYLLPVGPEGSDRRPAPEVWDGLLPAVAADPESLALTRRLYNNLPAELAVLPDPADLDGVAGPPPAGPAVVIRLADEPPTVLAGGALYGQLACRRDVRVRAGARGARFVDWRGLDPQLGEPDDLAVVLFVLSDHLLRARAGYAVFGGVSNTPESIRDEFPTGDAEALRDDLDRRVEEYLKRYRAPLTR